MIAANELAAVVPEIRTLCRRVPLAAVTVGTTARIEAF
jgi:hypothetical protein